MSIYAAISVSLSLLSFIFIWISFSIKDSQESKPLSYLFFFLGTLFVYISLFSIVELCEESSLAIATPLSYVMTSYMWIWIFVLLYFIVRTMFNAVVAAREKKEAGESFDIF